MGVDENCAHIKAPSTIQHLDTHVTSEILPDLAELEHFKFKYRYQMKPAETV